MIYQTDFEGAIDPATLLGNATIQDTMVINGTKSLKCALKYDGLQLVQSISQAFIEFQFLPQSFPLTTEKNAFIVKVLTETGSDLFWLGFFATADGRAKFYLSNFISSPQAFGSVSLQPNVTYLVNFDISKTATETRIVLKVNGIEDFSLIIPMVASDIGIIQIGQLWSAENMEFYFDDLKIDDASSAPPEIPTSPICDFTVSEMPIVNKAVTLNAIIVQQGFDGTNPTTITDYAWTIDGIVNSNHTATITYTFATEGGHVVSLVVTDSANQQSIPVSYTLTVITLLEHYTLDVGFESPNDSTFVQATPFPQGKLQVYPFQSEQSWYTATQKTTRAEAVQSPFYSDIAKKALREYFTNCPNPNDANLDDSRIHIRHLWNPMKDTDLWMEAKVLVPRTFNWVSRQWIELFCLLGERVYGWASSFTQVNAVGMSILNESDTIMPDPNNPDGRSLHRLQMYNTETGNLNRISWQDDGVSRWYRTDQGLPEGRPFSIRCHTHRPIDQPDPVLEGSGYVEVWMNDYTIKDEWVKMTWYELAGSHHIRTGTAVPIVTAHVDRVPCRTVSWNPFNETPMCDSCGYVYDLVHNGNNIPFANLPDTWICPLCGAAKSTFFIYPPMSEMPMAVAAWGTPWRSNYNQIRGWVDGGIDFYSGSNTTGVYVTNNEIFYDDVKLSNNPVGFAPPVLTLLTLNVNDLTMGTTDPIPGTYEITQGNTVQISAIPSTGHMFGHWELDGVNMGSTSPYSILMDTDHSILAVFAELPPLPPQKQHLTIASVNGQTNPTAGTYEVDKDTSVTVTCTPNSSYRFKEWLLDNVSVSIELSYTVLMDANHGLIAVCEAIPPPTIYTLFISATIGGTTHPVIGTYEHVEGTVVNVAPIPDNGYLFVNWTLDGQTITDNPINVTMNADHSLNAVFETLPIPPPGKQHLTIVAINGQTNPVAGTYTLDKNSSLTVTATPNTGYTFKHWLFDNVIAGTDPTITVTMDMDHTLVAVCEAVSPTPTLWTWPLLTWLRNLIRQRQG